MKPLNETSAERLERLSEKSPSGSGASSATPSLGGVVIFAIIVVAILAGMLIYGMSGTFGNYYNTIRDMSQ